MLRLFCKSKLQGLTVTATDINYRGSVTIDPVLAEAADIEPYEMVQVLSLANGMRIETYYIPGESGKGEICLNGAAARWFEVGDRVIILSTALYSEEEKKSAQPRIVITDRENRIIEKK